MRYFYVLCLLITSFNVEGQRMTEEEVRTEALFLSANQKKLLNKFDEAIEIYENILEKDPLNATVHHDMARIYLAQENFEDAKKSAEKAVNYDPDQIWFRSTYADICEITGDYKDAAEALSVIVRSVDQPQLYDRWAENLVQSGDIQSAINVLDQAQTRYGWEEYYTGKRVELYLLENDIRGAEKQMNTLVKSNEQRHDYWLMQGEFYLQIGKIDKAEKSFQKTLQLDPENEAALISLNALGNEENSEENIVLATFIKDDRIGLDNKIKTLIPFVQDLVMKDDQSRVNVLLELTAYLAANYPQEAKAHSIRGDVLAYTNHIDEAIESYRKTLSLNKSVYDVWAQLMAMLSEKGDIEGLDEIARDAIDFYPNQAGAYYYAATVAFERGDFDKTKALLQEASYMSGNDFLLHTKIILLDVDARLEKDDVDGAIRVLYDSVGEGAPVHPDIYERMGDLYLLKGDKSSAQENWKKALENGGNADRINAKIQSI